MAKRPLVLTMDLSPERVELLKRVYPATDIRPMDLFPGRRKQNHLGFENPPS